MKQTNLSALKIHSTAFDHEGSIPARYTCDGEDVSPALSWSGAPDGTKSYALIMDDPDAPVGTWVHWVAWNLPGTELAESLPTDAKLPDGMRQGQNSWKKNGYGGPCPPSGTHRYFFHFYALDEKLDIPTSTDAEGLRKAMSGHVLGEGVLMGRYSRNR